MAPRITHRPKNRISFLAVGMALACLAFAGTASGYTAATGSQRAAIEAAAHAKWANSVPADCPAGLGGPKIFGFRYARISSLDPRYALASIRDDGCTYTTGYVLRRPSLTSASWQVLVALPDSAQLCKRFAEIPDPVVREFGIEGLKGHPSTLTICAEATDPPYCDSFGVAYAINTSCAVELKVAALYAKECVPSSYSRGQLPACRRRLDGFLCTPSGDIYAAVNCVDNRRRVGLHLAE